MRSRSWRRPSSPSPRWTASPARPRTCAPSARSNRRQLGLQPSELTEAIRQARAQQQTGDWNRDYALRAGIEGIIRQATHTTGLRRARESVRAPHAQPWKWVPCPYGCGYVDHPEVRPSVLYGLVPQLSPNQ
jgi:hypothetical protein